jgi:hypothetical protein
MFYIDQPNLISSRRNSRTRTKIYSPSLHCPFEFYANFGFGSRLGVYRMSYSTNVAPERILKVPTTLFILGFLVNIHQNFGLGNCTTVDKFRDSLQFLGATFDASKPFNKIGTIK